MSRGWGGRIETIFVGGWVSLFETFLLIFNYKTFNVGGGGGHQKLNVGGWGLKGTFGPTIHGHFKLYSP